MKATSIALLLSLTLASLPAKADDSDSPPASPAILSAREKQSRALDERALWAKQSALRDLKGIAMRNKNPAQEPVLKFRLAEMLQEIAAVQYRLAYAKASETHRPANLRDYTTSMKTSIEPLNWLITRYPTYRTIQHAFYMRAKAYTETGNPEGAIVDLKHLVTTWPRSSDAQLAYIDLWTFMIQRKDYRGAIEYINRYGLRENDRYYHQALEKLAWCYYYLGDVEKALHYTEVELRTAKGLERDKAIANFSLFYANGFDRKVPGITAQNALPRFHNSVSGDDLGKLIVSYAFLLRTKEYDAELNALKEAAFNDGIADTYLADLIVLDIENQVNRQRFGDLQHSLEQEVALYLKSDEVRKDSRRMGKIRRNIDETIPLLQKFLAHDPGSSAKTLAASLRLCYQVMLDADKGDSIAKAKIHFNLAEVSLEMKDYESAVAHYRWVVDHVDQGSMEGRKLALTANVKSIESRYGSIKAQGWTSKELVAKPLSTQPKTLPAPIAQWMEWIDAFPKNALIPMKVDAIAFEATRLFYAFGYVAPATQRLEEFVLAFPSSTVAIPSASLVIDTYIASQKWEETHQLAEKFSQVKEFRGTDFYKHLQEISVDTYCKILDSDYQAKNYAEVVKKADAFLAANPSSKRRGDVLELAANAALGMGDKAHAAEYLQKVQAIGVKKAEIVQLSLMTNGSIAEEKFDFATAARNYRNQAEASHSVTPEMRSKILLYSWLSGNTKELEASLNSPVLCGKKSTECAGYKHRLEKGHAKKGSALARLESAQGKLSMNERMEILKAIPAEWDKVDPLDKYALLPMLTTRVPEFFHAIRKQVREAAPVKLDQSSIAKRNKLIENAQNLAEKLGELPWMRIRLAILKDSSGLYEDLSKEIRAIPAPKGLTGKDLQDFQQTLADASSPFSQKSDEIEKSRLQLAAQPGADATLSEASSWSGELAGSIGTPEKPNQKALVNGFREALADNNLPKAGFLIQRAQADDKDPLPSSTLALMKASLLARSGAVVEAMNEIKDASDVASNVKNRFANKGRTPAGDVPPGDTP